VEGGGTVELDIGLAYLELPLLLRAGPRRGRFRPVLFGGPAPSLQIGCDVQIADPNTPVRATCEETTLPAFLTVEGVAEPPEGELVLVLRRPPGLRDLLRRSVLFQAAVRATEVYVSPDPTQIPQP